MAEVIGVRFKNVGKVYYFDPDGNQVPKGGRVIVETARGIECGECTMKNRTVDDDRKAPQKGGAGGYARRCGPGREKSPKRKRGF